MPRKLTTTEFARRLEKARKTANNPFGLRSTEAIPAGARSFGLIKRKKKKILKPEVI